MAVKITLLIIIVLLGLMDLMLFVACFELEKEEEERRKRREDNRR